MKISVIGTGYVGLVTGTCFADTGNDVTCVDIDENKIQKLKNGTLPIYEPGLDVLFDRNTNEERLHFTTSLEEGIKGADVIFLALPTPSDEDGSADLKYILGVAENVGKLLTKYTVIIDKSTVPVGTADLVREKIKLNYSGDFAVVSNPEFLREGVAINDFMKPDRVVIGTTSDHATEIMKTLFNPLVRSGNPIIFMDEKSAELTKYAANSFLAMKISFMNEIANLCEKVGANVDLVRRGVGTDSRIGQRFLFAGIGWGGSCTPGNTLVKTPLGKMPIKKLRTKFLNKEKNLTVLSVNSSILHKTIQTINDVTEREYKGELFKFSWKDENDNVITSPGYTPEHLLPVFRNSKLIVVEAQNITSTDQLYTEIKKVKIINIEKEHFEGLVYNLELKGIEEKDDLFWIDGKTGLITHNCFPKDVLALKTTAQQHNYNFKLLEATIQANILQKRVLFDKILKKYGYGSQVLKDKTVAIWGLAFKPQTDDIREAPALEIIDNLLRVGATVKVFDPEATENVKNMYGDSLQYCYNQYDVLEDSDFLVIATEWNEFRTPDFNRIKTALKENVIFDGRNLYDLNDMEELKIEYHSIGR